MGFLVDLIREYGLGVVFLNVLIEQLGAPIPAYPVLVVTGAVAGDDWQHGARIVLLAVAAALIADLLWYQAGKSYGHRVLGRICRISLSPDACIRQTESLYGRWGPKSLLIAKFVPGFASIASALAGVVGTPRSVFVLYDTLGALIWVGSAVLLTAYFLVGSRLEENKLVHAYGDRYRRYMERVPGLLPWPGKSISAQEASEITKPSSASR